MQNFDIARKGNSVENVLLIFSLAIDFLLNIILKIVFYLWR